MMIVEIQVATGVEIQEAIMVEDMVILILTPETMVTLTMAVEDMETQIPDKAVAKVGVMVMKVAGDHKTRDVVEDQAIKIRDSAEDAREINRMQDMEEAMMSIPGIQTAVVTKEKMRIWKIALAIQIQEGRDLVEKEVPELHHAAAAQKNPLRAKKAERATVKNDQ
jgi:hypothetical protein